MATSTAKAPSAVNTSALLPASSTTLFVEAILAVEQCGGPTGAELPQTLYHPADPRLTSTLRGSSPWPDALQKLLCDVWGLPEAIVEVVACASPWTPGSSRLSLTSHDCWLQVVRQAVTIRVVHSTAVAFSLVHDQVKAYWAALPPLANPATSQSHERLCAPLQHWLVHQPQFDRQVAWFARSVKVLGCEQVWDATDTTLQLLSEKVSLDGGSVLTDVTVATRRRHSAMRDRLGMQQRCNATDRFPAAVSATDPALYPVRLDWPVLLCQSDEGGCSLALDEPQRWQMRSRVWPAARLFPDLLGLDAALRLETVQKGTVVYLTAILSPAAAGRVGRSLIEPPIAPAPGAWRFKLALSWNLASAELHGELFSWPADPANAQRQAAFRTTLNVLANN